MVLFINSEEHILISYEWACGRINSFVFIKLRSILWLTAFYKLSCLNLGLFLCWRYLSWESITLIGCSYWISTLRYPIVFLRVSRLNLRVHFYRVSHFLVTCSESIGVYNCIIHLATFITTQYLLSILCQCIFKPFAMTWLTLVDDGSINFIEVSVVFICQLLFGGLSTIKLGLVSLEVDIILEASIDPVIIWVRDLLTWWLLIVFYPCFLNNTVLYVLSVNTIICCIVFGKSWCLRLYLIFRLWLWQNKRCLSKVVSLFL